MHYAYLTIPLATTVIHEPPLRSQYTSHQALQVNGSNLL